MKKSIVIPLTLLAVLGAGKTFAADPLPLAPAATIATPVASPVANAAAPVEPGLPVRPSKPLVLAEMPKSGPHDTSVKLVGGGVILAAAAAFLRFRKKKNPAPAIDMSSLRIVRRTSLGMRNELIIVETDGQQLLLGVTAQSIQLLTTLGDVRTDDNADRDAAADHTSDREPNRFAHVDDDADEEDERDHARARRALAKIPRDRPNQGARFAALLRATGVDEEEAEPNSTPRRATRPSAAREQAPLEGQVRALATWGPRR